jgi:hypothetical protein
LRYCYVIVSALCLLAWPLFVRLSSRIAHVHYQVKKRVTVNPAQPIKRMVVLENERPALDEHDVDLHLVPMTQAASSSASSSASDSSSSASTSQKARIPRLPSVSMV